MSDQNENEDNKADVQQDVKSDTLTIRVKDQGGEEV